MKLLVALVLVVCAFAAASGKQLPPSPLELTAYDYLRRFGVPRAEEIRKFEEQLQDDPGRIVGGSQSQLGQHPWQAGLISDIIGLTGNGVCGGSLISHNRVVTAAHCWSDGQNQAWRFTVVLGSILLFSGGLRQETASVFVHNSWNPLLIRNDIAVIHLPSSVQLSNTISPIALPSGSEVSENFAGDTATASGFGITSDGGSISLNQFLSHVQLDVITNSVCNFAFFGIIQESNICTSGSGGTSTCGGDSGGPLSVYRNGRPILIGVTSFGLALGCQVGWPAAFCRVTSYLDFINQHLN